MRRLLAVWNPSSTSSPPHSESFYRPLSTSLEQCLLYLNQQRSSLQQRSMNLIKVPRNQWNFGSYFVSTSSDFIIGEHYSNYQCTFSTVATGIAVFLSALELTSVGTALPTIVEDIGGADFIWIGSAYALASSAFMPASGGLSNIFGRRAVMLSSIAFFAIGSALAGVARNMNMLIAARGSQRSLPSFEVTF